MVSYQSRQRGSTLLLVIASLLLTMVLGLTLIQVVRQDRVGATEMSGVRSRDAVARIIVDNVRNKLVESMGISGSGGAGGAAPFQTENSRPFDYPSDNQRWLASTAPARRDLNPSGKLEYARISRISEQFANGDTENEEIEARSVITLYGYQMGEDIEYELPTDSGVYADADGNQIVDSKFEVAPIKNYRGVEFFMAVHVVDNSAKLNVNTALMLSDGDGNFNASPELAPRMTNPSELNLADLALQAFGSDNYTQEMQEFIKYRMGGGNGVAQYGQSIESATSTRLGYWARIAAVYGGTQTDGSSGGTGGSGLPRFGVDTDLMLSRRGGLSTRGARKSKIEVSGEDSGSGSDKVYGLAKLLRSDEKSFSGDEARQELLFQQVLEGANARLSNNQAQDTKNIELYYQIFDFQNPNAQRTMRNARLWLTAASGHVPFSPLPKLDVDGDGKNDVLKVNINDRAGNMRKPEQWAKVIKEVYREVSGDDNLAGLSSSEEFAEQFAANIVDYIDADNKLTKHNNRIGWEPLPFISEVYVQTGLKITAAKQSTTDPMEWECTFEREGETGWAIEIRNPYNRRISLEGIEVYVEGTRLGVLSGLAGKDFLEAKSAVVLFRNSGSGSAAEDDVTKRWTSSGTVTTGSGAGSTPWPQGSGDSDEEVTIELRASLSDGSVMTSAYQKFKGVKQREKIEKHTVTNDGDPKDQIWFAQSFCYGNGNGYNAMTVKEDEVKVEHKKWGDSANYDAGTDLLGVANKGTDGVADKLKSENIDPQFVFANGNGRQSPTDEDEEFQYVAELAHIAVFGFKVGDDETVAEILDGEDTLMKFYPGLEQDGSGFFQSEENEAYRVPPMAALMDVFTTHAPHDDQKDNDGDGKIDLGDTDGEFLIPGTINLNTAPYGILMAALPIDDLNTRHKIAKAIIEFRDQPDKRDGPSKKVRTGNNNYGIASIGELLADPMFEDGLFPTDRQDSSKLSGSQVPIDFLGNPKTETAPDGVKDDAEELTAIVRWLYGTCAVRSDIFTVHILLRGYGADSADSGDPPQPTEEKRIVVVLDRSGVAFSGSGSAGVKILGWHEE